MGRQYVHLSADEAAARVVGSRQDRHPVILRILASEGWKAGLKFYRGNDAIWLADEVPVEFIEAPR
jgi:putative RNA 2'-phosphotransferase